MARERSAIYAVVRGLWWLFVVVVFVPFVAFAAAQTRFAKDWLAEQISAAASDDETIVKVGRIDGLVPTDLTVDAVSIADRDGVWLTAREVAVRWSPERLLGGTLAINHLGAADIVVERPPATADDAQDAPSDSLSLESPVAVAIDRIDLLRIELGEPVAGVAAVLGAAGSMELDAERGALSIDLVAERKDGVPGSAKIAAHYALAEQTATLDIAAEEPAGGVIAGLIGLPEPAAVALSAKGSGGLSDWAGTLTARIDGYADLSADLTLRESASGDQISLDLSGAVARLAGVFVPELEPVLEPGLTMTAAAIRDRQGVIALERVEASAGPTRIALAGQIDPATWSGDITFDAEPEQLVAAFAPDMAPLAAGQLTGRIAGAYGRDGAVTVEHASLVSPAGALTAQGAIDTARERIALDVEIADARLDAFAELADAPLAGTVDIAGSVEFDGEGGALSVDLVAERKDGVPGSAKIVADYALAEQTATLDIAAEEPAGGVIAGLIGLPKPAAVALSTKGSGGLSDWAGTLAARIDGYADLAADLTLRESEAGHRISLNMSGEAARLAGVFVPELETVLEPGVTVTAAGTRDRGGVIALERVAASAGPTRITLAGQIDPATSAGDITFDAEVEPLVAAFAPEIAPLVSGQASGRIAGAYGRDGAVTLDQASVVLPAGALTAQGIVDTARERLSLEIEVADFGLGAVADLAGTPLAGTAEFAGRIEGDYAAVAVSDARLAISDFATDGAAFARLEATLSATPEGGWAAADLAVAFRGDGFVRGLVVDGQEDILAPLIDDRLDWQVAGLAKPASSTVTFSEIALASETGVAGGTGSIDADGRVSAGLLVDLDALNRFAGLAGIAIDGGVSATVDLSADPAAGTVEAAFAADFRALRTGIEAADVALGRRPTAQGIITIDPAGDISVRELSLRGDGLAISGPVRLAADQTLTGDLRIAVRDLAKYSGLAGVPITGALTADVRPGGTLSTPTVAVDFTGSQIVVNDAPAADVTGQLTALDLLEVPRGSLSLKLAAGGIDADIGTAYRLEPSRLGLTDLAVRSSDVTVTGEVAVAFDSGLVSGTLTGRADSIAAVASFAGLGLDGALSFDAALGADEGTQTMTLSAEASRLSFPDADLAADRLVLSADGALDGFAAEVTVEGGVAAGRPVALDGAARIALTESAAQATVDRLNAVIDGTPITLTRAATIVQDEEGVRLEGPRFALADGMVDVDGALTRNDVRANLKATGLSLAHFREGTEGVVSGEAMLSGAPPRPDAVLALRVAGLRDASLAVEDLPSVDAALDARWRDGVVDSTIAVTGFEQARLDGTLSVPMTMDPDSFAPVIAEDAAISGRIDGEAELGELAAFFLSDLDRLVGHLAVELQVAGTLAAPTASGRLAIANGVYENGTAGTVLTNLDVELAGDGERIVVRRLSATDGGAGTINGAGSFGIDPDGGFPTDLSVRLANFLAVRRADAEVPLDGELTFTGDMAGYALAGQLTVPQAEIRIPDKLPPNVVQLDVVEVGGDARPTGPKNGTPTAATAPVPVSLDLAIDMPGRVFVRGRGLTSEWRGALTATGPAEAPLVVGQLTLVRGTFDLVGKTLSLERGMVTLTEDAPGDPEIDALATTSLEDGTARVEITGSASNPRITLTSEPPLPEDEVLARLLFGSSVGELTPVQAVQLANGIATLTGQGSGLGLLDKIRETAGVDTLDVRSNGEEAADTSVRAGKYLADDVMLYIEQGSAAGSSKATLEVDLNDYLSVETDVGADAQSSIGVNVKVDY